MTKKTDNESLIQLERQRFADFQRATSEWSWETDIQDRFTYMSTNVQEMTGIAAEWHYGKTREDLGIREQMGEIAWTEFQAVLKKREAFHNLTYARRGPDKVTWVQSSGIPYYEHGRFCGYRGSGRIVTKEIETAQLADRLTAALENIGDYFSLWDENDRLIFANRAFMDLHKELDTVKIGVGFSAHIRTVYQNSVASNDPQTIETTIQERIRHHKNPGVPFEFSRKNGTILLINDHKLPGGLTATIATDVTRLRSMEKENAEKAEIVETAFGTIPDGILVIGADGKPVTWNNYLFSIFDIVELKSSPTEDLRNSLLTIISRQLGTTTNTRQTSDLSSLILHPNKHAQHEFQLPGNKWVEYRGSPMAGGGYIMTFRDFTERYQLDRLKSEFVSTVSHELRTPLTSIIGSLGLVMGGAAGDVPIPARDLIQIGIENGERLLKLINDILDLEKISHDEFELETENLSVFELVDASVKANTGYAERYNVQLKVINGDDDLTIKGDRHRLMQVMDNLLSNAMKFSNPLDEVEIQISGRRGLARIAITDQGPGVPRKFQKTIFDRFVQVDSSDTRSIAGTGLGLSICKGIVAAHGGQIKLYSTPAMGSTFYFELPILKDLAS